MPEQQKRQTAYKVRIKHLLSGQYVKEEGWLPNYVVVDSKNISRVNIIGTIVSNANGEAVLDDGSAGIVLRSFGDSNEMAELNVGDIVLAIGKIREYSSQKYVVPEIIRKTGKEWLELRELELKRNELLNPVTDTTAKTEKVRLAEEEQAAEEEVVRERSGNDEEKKVYEAIKALDSGEGAAIDEVIQKSGEAEEIINRLLNRGDIFEIKPGKIKILE